MPPNLALSVSQSFVIVYLTFMFNVPYHKRILSLFRQDRSQHRERTHAVPSLTQLSAALSALNCLPSQRELVKKGAANVLQASIRSASRKLC